MKTSTAGLALTLLLVVSAAVGLWGPQSPAPLSADAPADRFSAARAYRHLEAIAREPHPMGTPEHRRVRDYVIAELTALGLTPQLQETTSLTKYSQGVVAFGHVVNVAARLEGRGDGPALLLVSHYDTVPQSPGAADDGTGVALMLEIARALSPEAPLANDVIFLFTDGEEPGLLGARAFAEQHPWASDVGMVLNFEARGTRGPALMFETSAGNAPLIRELDRAVDNPVASSYSYEIYRRMPNDTDFSVFRRKEMPGLNFAFIHGGTAYHTSRDSLDRLDLASVQHMGASALGLARDLGNADLDARWQTRDAIYFDLPGDVLVTYPGGGSLVLAALLAVAVIVVLVAGFRRGRLTAAGVAGAFVVDLLGTAAFGAVLAFAAGRVMSRYNFELGSGWASQPLALVGLGLIAAALTLAVFRGLRGKVRPANLVAGGLVTWLLLTLAVSILTPGASFLFAWPLAAASGAAVLGWRRDAEDRVTVPLFVTLALAVVVSVLLWAPTLNVIGVALGPVAAGLVGAMVFLLLFGPLAPAIAVTVEGGRRWLAPVAALTAGVVLLVLVAASSSFDADNPRPDSLLYALDTATGEARWLSYDDAADAWTSRFLTADPQRVDRPAFLIFPGSPMLANAAPVAPLAGAEVRWLAERETASGRQVDLAITWPYEVQRAIVSLGSEAEILAVANGGQRTVFDDVERKGLLHCIFFAPPADGLELTVELSDAAPLEVRATAQRYGLPEIPGSPIPPRPADLMPRPGWTIDSTFVTSTETWNPGDVSPAEEDVPEAVPQTDER